MTDVVHLRGLYCGLPCAPMSLAIDRGAVSWAEGGCPVCRDQVMTAGRSPDAPRTGGRETSLDQATAAAARLLREARAPFLYGLARSSNETARLAARLAADLGAALDLEGGDALQANLLALQTYGLPSATFGEIRNRADLLLFWRCDPRATHPHLFERRAGTPLQEGGERTFILVPVEGAPGAISSEGTLAVEAGGDLAVLLAIRAFLRDRPPAAGTVGGVPRAKLMEVAERLRRASYAAILWDGAATSGALGPAVAAALTVLARDLNLTGRGVARPLASGNLAGAMAALAGETGAPRACGFRRGGPARFGPAEFGAERFIADGRADLCLLIGAGAFPAASNGAGKSRRPRTIVVGPRLPEGLPQADVLIPTALPGLSAAGAGRRADGLPVVLRAPLPSVRPSEEMVLETLRAALLGGAES